MNLLASLRYLVALHEHRHFGRAAQACHITQPALSNALRALEKEFGVVVVRDVPAQVCDLCGTDWLEDPVAERDDALTVRAALCPENAA